MEEDIKILEEFLEAYRIAEEVLDGDIIQAIENLIARYKELEEYKKDVELTKIVCCVAQNCEALNNCIKLRRENAELKSKLQELLED